MTIKKYVDKNKKKIKWNYYVIKEVPTTGEERIKKLSKNVNWDDLDEDLYLIRSRMTLKERRESEEMWKYLGNDRGFCNYDYTDFIKACSEGGSKSSRRKWKNNAEKQRAVWARKKFEVNKGLTEDEIKLLIKGGWKI